MRKRFVVLTGNITLADENAIRAFVTNRYGWWHWLPNSWLMTDALGQLTAQSLRDELQKIAPNAHIIVLEFNATGDTWAGQAPATWFDWLRDTWEKMK